MYACMIVWVRVCIIINLDPGDSQIHILLKNIDSPSPSPYFSLFPFSVSLTNQLK